MLNEDISKILTAIGGIDEDVQTVFQTGEAEWVVRYPEADVEIVHVASDRRLVFVALCGIPPKGRTSAVYAVLLRFNAIWRETGSLRLALSGDEGEVALIADMLADDLDEQRVALVAHNVADRSVAWRHVVEAGAPSSPRSELEPAELSIIRA